MKKYTSLFALIITFVAASAAPAFALSVNMDANASARASSSSTSSSGQTDADVGIGFEATVAPSNRESVQTSSGLITITSANQVQTDDDLDAYAMSLRQRNSSVNQVTTSDTGVFVEYKIPAKLFGFISVNMSETASIEVKSDNTTSVDVRRPWWSAFAKAEDHTDAFKANLKSRVPGSVSAAGAVDSKVLNSSFKARFIADIEASAQATF